MTYFGLSTMTYFGLGFLHFDILLVVYFGPIFVFLWVEITPDRKDLL